LEEKAKFKNERNQFEVDYLEAKSKAQELEFELSNIFKSFKNTDWE
jgi:hypothetical protein